MKKNALALPLAVGAFLLGAGCGDDVTKTTVVNETTGIAQLAKGDTLPECTKDNAGEMLYVADSGAVYHCTGKAWATLNGTDGTDGKDGASGESCEAVALKDGSGYKILCGADSIGVVLNGADGEKGDSGAIGATGETGAVGEGCTVADDGSGTVTVACGENVSTLYKALCANAPFDPANAFCTGDSIVTLCGGKTYDVGESFCFEDSVVSFCGGKSYDLKTEFCTQKNSKDTLVALCGGEPYDISGYYCENDTVKVVYIEIVFGHKDLGNYCGNSLYNPDTGYCHNDSVYSCGQKPYNPTESFCTTQNSQDTVVALCGGESYDLNSCECKDDAVSCITIPKFEDDDDSTIVIERYDYSMCGSSNYNLYTQMCDARDNQVYKITTIGEQIWMAENLNYAYNEGTATSYCYGNSADSCEKYGRLYTWSAAMDSAAVFSANGSGCGYGKTCTTTEPVRGVCPEGWHLPTLAEFNTLIAAVGGQSSAGAKLKATSGWNNNGNGSDAYGFSALPAGYRFSDGDFYDAGYDAYFWSATEYDTVTARSMDLNFSDAYLYDHRKYLAFSVRCLKD